MNTEHEIFPCEMENKYTELETTTSAFQITKTGA